ncbi:MAG: ATP-binding protein [Pirellulaceae bacterium]
MIMSEIQSYTETFAQISARTIEDMFGVSVKLAQPIEELKSVQCDRSFMISLFYTGTVYGEYMLAMDEQTAARIIGAAEANDDDAAFQLREEICDAMSETLNTIVGESIIELQTTYPKLSLTAPRVIFGQVRYPQFRTGKAILESEFGLIECHFCLDLMRLDVTTSLNAAMDSLVEINAQLKEANKQLAEQQAHLVLTEKMASVGILASGIAHEINNPLFFVDTNLSTLCDYVRVIDTSISMYGKLVESLDQTATICPVQYGELKGHTEAEDLDFILEDTKTLMSETRQGIQRIKTIVQNLKDFSHVDHAGHAEANLNTIIENTCQLIASSLPEHCRLIKRLPDIPKIICNAGEIGQAIASVLINAGQAVEPQGGEIRITTEFIDNQIRISIVDNGSGINAEDLPRVFDPFFTTKALGEATGLGLSITYGILEKHGGKIKIDSTVDCGTRVSMSFPVSPSTPRRTAMIESAHPSGY